MKPVVPAKLQPGDTMGIIAPAGVVDRTKLDRALERIRALGYRTKYYRDIYAQRGYLAGSDSERVAELHEAFADPECRAIFAARGGYGCIRIVDQIDFDLVRANPKIFIGFSDITVLHAAFWRATGLVTFHGPHPSDSYGRPEGPTDLTAEWLWKTLTKTDRTLPCQIRHHELRTYRPGSAEGRLVGGNLALVCSLLGSRHSIDFEDNILFFEDTDEPPYRIDRFLAQLRLSGVFDQVAGIVLGQFTRCVADDADSSLTLDEVLDDHLSSLKCPILVGFPAGHGNDNVTVPLGVRVRLNADEPSLALLEPAICGS